MIETHDTAKRALGSGIAFPIRTNRRGGLVLSDADERVRQSIQTILSTARGERVMRPDFGCDIHRFVFDVLNSNNLVQIRSAVREALTRWEPRITVNDVSVNATQDRAKESYLNIDIRYTIRLTNFQTNLVYPFYLSPGG